MSNNTYLQVDQQSYEDIIDRLTSVLELFNAQSEPWGQLFEIERLLHNIDPKTGARLTGTRRVERPGWIEGLGLELPQ